MKNNVEVEFRLSKDGTPGVLMSFEELSQGGDVDILSHLLDDLKTKPLVGQVYSSKELTCERYELPEQYRQDDSDADFDITLVPKSYKKQMINFIVFADDNSKSVAPTEIGTIQMASSLNPIVPTDPGDYATGQ